MKGAETTKQMLIRRGSIKSFQPGVISLSEPAVQESSGEFRIRQIVPGGIIAFLSLRELEWINKSLQANEADHLRAGIQAAIFATRYNIF